MTKKTSDKAVTIALSQELQKSDSGSMPPELADKLAEDFVHATTKALRIEPGSLHKLYR